MDAMTGTKKTKYCVDELLKRPPAERAAAAETLLQSLDGRTDASSSPGLSQAWVDEIQRRIDENAPGIPASIVFSEGRARLRKLRRPLWSS
jgi:hypothetical protein